MTKKRKSIKKKRKPSSKSVISKYIHNKLYTRIKKESGKVSKLDRVFANEEIEECYKEWKAGQDGTPKQFAKEWVDTIMDAEEEQSNQSRMWRP